MVDVAFIEQPTAGFDECTAFCRAQDWVDQIGQWASGLMLRTAASAPCGVVTPVWRPVLVIKRGHGIGITQHKHSIAKSTCRPIITGNVISSAAGRVPLLRVPPAIPEMFGARTRSPVGGRQPVVADRSKCYRLPTPV